jgi:hypothetical protein
VEPTGLASAGTSQIYGTCVLPQGKKAMSRRRRRRRRNNEIYRVTIKDIETFNVFIKPKCIVFHKKLYNGIPKITVSRLERWILCTPLSVNVFVTFATQTFGIPL